MAPTFTSADHIEQRAVSDGWVQAQVQVSSAREGLKWQSHHPKGVPQPPRHLPTRPRPDCAAPLGGAWETRLQGRVGQRWEGLSLLEREGEGGVGGVGRVSLGGALHPTTAFSLWEAPCYQKLLSLSFCSSKFQFVVDSVLSLLFCLRQYGLHLISVV